MEVKLFEVRDSATFIPCIGISMISNDDVEHWLLRRAGYDAETLPQDGGCLLFGRLDGGKMSYDPHSHGQCRTMGIAHDFVARNWDTIDSGSVVCVETICGERESPKESERLTTTF